MTGITIYNVQRVVTPEAGNSELWFLCSAYHIMVIYICIKFQEISQTVFKLQSRHILQKSLFSMFKGPNSKIRSSRSTICVFCTWSHDALHLCEVLSKYLKCFPTHHENMPI